MAEDDGPPTLTLVLVSISYSCLWSGTWYAEFNVQYYWIFAWTFITEYQLCTLIDFNCIVISCKHKNHNFYLPLIIDIARFANTMLGMGLVSGMLALNELF